LRQFTTLAESTALQGTSHRQTQTQLNKYDYIHKLIFVYPPSGTSQWRGAKRKLNVGKRDTPTHRVLVGGGRLDDCLVNDTNKNYSRISKYVVDFCFW